MLRTKAEINNKIANWILNEMYHVCNKYKITFDEFCITCDINYMANVIRLDLTGELNHNEVKKMFYAEFDKRYKVLNG